MTSSEAEKILNTAIAQLGEHFDAVQILASWRVADGGTQMRPIGLGNWYARQGMAHAFIQCDVADDTAHKIAEVLNPPPEDFR